MCVFGIYTNLKRAVAKDRGGQHGDDGQDHRHAVCGDDQIRYSDVFGAPGIRYSVIIKLPCALLLTDHLETVHAPVADTVTYFAGLDAPVVDTVTYFGGNHRSRV